LRAGISLERRHGGARGGNGCVYKGVAPWRRRRRSWLVHDHAEIRFRWQTRRGEGFGHAATKRRSMVARRWRSGHVLQGSPTALDEGGGGKMVE